MVGPSWASVSVCLSYKSFFHLIGFGYQKRAYHLAFQIKLQEIASLSTAPNPASSFVACAYQMLGLRMGSSGPKSRYNNGGYLDLHPEIM